MHANKLFSGRVPNTSMIGAKRYPYSGLSYDKAEAVSRVFVRAVVGLSILGIMGYGFYMGSSIKGLQLVIGKPAPEALRDLSDPDCLVWRNDQVPRGGPGDGAEGRSAPNEGSIERHDKTTMRGYCKMPGNGRTGFLNELVYHALVKEVSPGLHPHIKLIETPIGATQSSYELFIESIGDNSNLLQHCKNLSKHPELGFDSRLQNVGCSLAFAALILSADNFMKNFVVVYQPDQQGFVYPIDFELLDNSKERSLEIEYVDLNKSPEAAMRSFIANGALLDYKESFRGNEYLRGEAGAEDTSEIGKGLTAFGFYHGRDIYRFILQSAVEDVRNGNILAMYERIAALHPEDIDRLINKFDFIMTETELNDYRHNLLQIVEKTQEFLSKYNQTPRPGL